MESYNTENGNHYIYNHGHDDKSQVISMVKKASKEKISNNSEFSRTQPQRKVVLRLFF